MRDTKFFVFYMVNVENDVWVGRLNMRTVEA